MVPFATRWHPWTLTTVLIKDFSELALKCAVAVLRGNSVNREYLFSAIVTKKAKRKTLGMVMTLHSSVLLYAIILLWSWNDMWICKLAGIQDWVLQHLDFKKSIKELNLTEKNCQLLKLFDKFGNASFCVVDSCFMLGEQRQQNYPYIFSGIHMHVTEMFFSLYIQHILLHLNHFLLKCIQP